MKPLWLVCYDIRDNKRRQKLAKALERHCQRVQYSVFECPLDTKTLEKYLTSTWLPLLKLPEDSLRAYPLNLTAQQQAKVYGSANLYEPPDFIIL